MLEKIRDQIKAAVPRPAEFNIAVNAQGETARAYGKLVEAAGIEPSQLDDFGAVSRRYRAEVCDFPRKTGGCRALSRAPKRHAATSVEQRDHDGPRAGQNRPRGDAKQPRLVAESEHVVDHVVLP